jgi:nucleoside-diphosphate-sugar epimerase
MRKILITGAAGFVGRHLTQRLLETGDEVHAVDSLLAGTGALDPDGTWPLFDPRDYRNFRFYREDCRSFFQRTDHDDFALCFHLAAIVGGRQMIEGRPLAVAEDLAIDSAYWQWAVRSRPAKSVCFSSSAAYPLKYQQQEGYQLLREDMISFETDIGPPDMSYGWSKLTNEYLARLAYRHHGLKSVVYRPFSGYGEDQDTAYPFPSICRRALAEQGGDTLTVWGTGEQMRDFIHIEDCISGILQTMDRIDDAGAVNLSTGIYTSFKQLAALAAEVCGYTPEIIGLSNKPSGVFARAGDTTLQQELGFVPQISLRSGVERAMGYIRHLPVDG